MIVLIILIVEMSWIIWIKILNKIVDVNVNRWVVYYVDIYLKWLVLFIVNECVKRIIFIVNFDNVVFMDES